jgi:hypothetical protein
MSAQPTRPKNDIVSYPTFKKKFKRSLLLQPFYHEKWVKLTFPATIQTMGIQNAVEK